ncbi:MAG: FAD-dependent oxidoreductase [Proteobacteria bacterium]|nr:FAD-dependent oxidoreductase [Pseudomonadota bacterium]
MSRLEHLFAPIRIRNMELANRAVMPPMGTWLSEDDASVGDRLLAYISRQAQSGAGLIISEVACVHPSGSAGKRHMGAYDDRFIPGLKQFARTIHDAGGKAALQLHHAGRESFFLLQQGQAVGPSALPSLVFRQTPNEMTPELIEEVIEAFGRAAVRAREAGFDAVEVHGAHGYLLTQFLSALSNIRQDRYGGDLEGRATMLIEVLASVRKAVGDDFPVLLRISAEEFIKDGYMVEDLVPILPKIVAAGADVIHASIGTHGSPGGITSAPQEYEAGFNAWRAQKIKEVVDVPVIAVGRFTDPADADACLARGEADMISFGRQQLADPDYLIKARAGRTGDIRQCIACNQGCIERIMFEPGSSVRCAINPETGQERDYPRVKAATPQTVWIVGSGPAGLTAAAEAARLGHRAIILEEADQPGGQIRYAARPPHKEIYGRWIDWLIGQVRDMGVEIKTGTAVTGAMIDEGRPDAVILAAGGTKIVPPLPGLDLPLVCDAWQVLDGRVQAGTDVVVVGGGLIGMETADFLRTKGATVVIIEMLKRSPVAKVTSHGYMLHKRLRDGGCRLMLGAQVERIESDAVVVQVEGETQTLSPVDQVVLAVGMKPRDDLKAHLETKGIRHFVVGDAAGPRRIIEATEEGARAAWSL